MYELRLERAQVRHVTLYLIRRRHTTLRRRHTTLRFSERGGMRQTAGNKTSLLTDPCWSARASH